MIRLAFISHFSKIVKTKLPLNSIEAINNNIAFGYYFPKQWSQQDIYKLIDPTKKNIKQIIRIKNKLGQYNGKIMFKFDSEQVLEKYVSKYNEDYIITKDSTQKVVLKPFQLKTEAKKREKQQYRSKNCVKVTNLNFQVTKNQIQKLAVDYGEICSIEMDTRTNGLNKGMCKVYFFQRSPAIEFTKFINQFQHYDRQLKAQLINPLSRKEQQLKLLELPKRVFDAHRQLMKRETIKKNSFVNEQ